MTLPVIAFVWDNFGPLHQDRIEAVASRLERRWQVVGIQHEASSDTYSWTTGEEFPFDSVTLRTRRAPHALRGFSLAWRLIVALIRVRVKVVFLCHYEAWPNFLAAIILRLLGRRVLLMGCAKFDDRPRSAWREVFKVVALSPYQGALVGSSRTQSFFSFLGMRRKPFSLGYNTVSGSRIRMLAGENSVRFEDRDFIIVARLVEKKNIRAAIQAFSILKSSKLGDSRFLHICGDGPLDSDLRQQAVDLGISKFVLFHGFLQSDRLSPLVSKMAALILVSSEEQFGNVVPEALALGIPVILSDACGARYELLKSGINGWLVEPDNPEGIAVAMQATIADENSWLRLSAGALKIAGLGDVSRFADGVESLLGSGYYREST